MINVVPYGAPTSSIAFSSPPSITYRTPTNSPCVFEMHSTCDTAAMLDRASPRNPNECTFNKSVAVSILLVACLKKASLISSFAIPSPLSVILIREMPPSFISTVIAVALASIAFSKSSLTTEDGLSTTSPAAILSMVLLSSTLIFFII